MAYPLSPRPPFVCGLRTSEFRISHSCVASDSAQYHIRYPGSQTYWLAWLNRCKEEGPLKIWGLLACFMGHHLAGTFGIEQVGCHKKLKAPMPTHEQIDELTASCSLVKARPGCGRQAPTIEHSDPSALWPDRAAYVSWRDRESCWLPHRLLLLEDRVAEIK